MRVVGTDGKPVEGLYCIGDANGKLMLAHAASAQGISAVETMCGRPHVVNHLAVPAACFTHPEVSFVGLTQEQAEAKGKEHGFPVKVSKTSFKANSKALAELEPDGMAKMIYNGATGEILGVHIFGLHAADLIHEASNAMLVSSTVQELKFAVHAHPTLGEVIDEVFKGRVPPAAPLRAAPSHLSLATARTWSTLAPSRRRRKPQHTYDTAVGRVLYQASFALSSKAGHVRKSQVESAPKAPGSAAAERCCKRTPKRDSSATVSAHASTCSSVAS